MAPTNAVKARFWSKVQVLEDLDACWIWQAAYSLKRCGTYRPAFWLGGTVVIASRLVCLWANGDPPTPQHEAAHSCHNRRCVNPRHLSWKTSSENKRRV